MGTGMGMVRAVMAGAPMVACLSSSVDTMLLARGGVGGGADSDAVPQASSSPATCFPFIPHHH